MKVAQELKEAHIPRQGGFADPPKHPQIGLQQRNEALGPILMHVTAGILFLRMIDKVMRIALERTIATRGVRIESAPRLDREVGRLLHRLDGKIPRRVDHDPSLAADPHDDGGPILVVMASPRLAFLAAPPWRAAQGLFPALFGLALVASGMIQVVGFDRPR